MFMQLLALMVMAAPPATVELRREVALDFAPDEAFQQDGGVQYFYELGEPTSKPAADSALARFRAMDAQSTPEDPYQVLMSRFVYTVERDISFFTEARGRDVRWMNQVAPEMGVKLEPDGSFRVARTPSNRFKLTWFEAPVAGSDPALVEFFRLLPKGQQPASIVVQQNFDFARVMAFRTAERAVTFTAHYPRGPGRTQLFVCNMSLLYSVPPFFLGGRDRVFRESVEGAAKLIEQLRTVKD